ncbi:MAG: calcium/sodium antiporter [Caldilinea sp.]|nr:calcium/sodium antiporter [Caldilinea sp.]MDW8441821.1 calcium/sodium antiporter [Caldilineaceae bacterium]
MALILLLMLGGLVTLVTGAELLVRGASRLAAALGVSPLIIGLTIVAFGTSSPELAVSVQSALRGQADVAVGNVVGSNIFNVLFILGLSALITPLIVAQQLVRFDVPLMIGVSIVFWLFALNGYVERWEGALFFAGILAYTVFLAIQSRRERNAAVLAEYEAEFRPKRPHSWLQGLVDVGIAGGGLALLVFGARWFVDGAVAAAEAFGVSELVIGLTIVAAGTSLPEVATSIVAALRGERDIAVGNVVGSNIFNILAVLGLTALVAPGAGVPVSSNALWLDMPFMIVVAIACLPIFFTGYLIARWEGLLFLGYYIIYTAFLILSSIHYPHLAEYRNLFLLFAAPLTIITIGVSLARDLRQRRKMRHSTNILIDGVGTDRES